jgi:hypothetical protein
VSQSHLIESENAPIGSRVNRALYVVYLQESQNYSMRKRSQIPDIQAWAYQDAPEDLRARCSPLAEWLLVASEPSTEGLRQYLAKAGIVAQSVVFRDGRMLCWGGPDIVAAVTGLTDDKHG